MSEDLPDWLRDIAPRDAEDDDGPAQEPSAPVTSSPVADENERAVEGGDWDMLGDLREGMEAEAAVSEEDPTSRRKSSRRIAGLLPWQRFVLALLAFFDIAFVGFIFLVILGRIAIL